MEGGAGSIGNKQQAYDPPGTEYGSEIIAAGLIITLFICTLAFIFITLRKMVISTPSPAVSILRWQRQYNKHKLQKQQNLEFVDRWLIMRYGVWKKKKEWQFVAMLGNARISRRTQENHFYKHGNLSRVWEV